MSCPARLVPCGVRLSTLYVHWPWLDIKGYWTNIVIIENGVYLCPAPDICSICLQITNMSTNFQKQKLCFMTLQILLSRARKEFVKNSLINCAVILHYVNEFINYSQWTRTTKFRRILDNTVCVAHWGTGFRGWKLDYISLIISSDEPSLWDTTTRYSRCGHIL